MGLFDSIVLAPAIKASGPGPLSDFWYESVTGPTASGIRVSSAGAMNTAAFNTCVRLIAEMIAAMPCHIREDIGDDGSQPARNHPLYRLLLEQPNDTQSAYEFWELMIGNAAGPEGNGYAQIVPGPRGFADQFIPLDPTKVRSERVPVLGPAGRTTFRRRYHVQDWRTGEAYTLLDDEMFHLMFFSRDGITGMRTLDVMAETLGWSQAIARYGSRSFTAAKPPGVLEHPGQLTTEAREAVGLSFDAKYSSGGRTAVLQEGMKYHTLTSTNEEAQMLESRGDARREIYQFFRIPPALFGDTEKSTTWGTGLEQMAIGLSVFVLLPWVKRLEQAIKRDLILSDRFYARFSMQALLRGDYKTRMEGYAIGIDKRILSPNEARAFEELNPYEGGDEFPAAPSVPAGSPAPAQQQSAPPSEQARNIVREVAARLVHKEVVAVSKAAKRSASDPAGWAAWLDEFYGAHADEVQRALYLTQADALAYCAAQKEQLVSAGVGVIEDWESEVPGRLASLALGESR